MGHLYRSEEMSRVELYLQTDEAYQCAREIGHLGMVAFDDMNPDVSAFQRRFVGEVRRCDEMDRKLRFFNSQLEAENIGVSGTIATSNSVSADARDMDDLETQFDMMDSELREMNRNEDSLRRDLLRLVEMNYILQLTATFFAEAEARVTEEPSEDVESGNVHLSFVTGVINRSLWQAFERIMWRVSRGNVFLRMADIDEPLRDLKTQKNVSKAVFIAFFHGAQLQHRVHRICEAFDASLYPCPATADKRSDATAKVADNIQEHQSVLTKTAFHRLRVLRTVAEHIDTWQIKVLQLKRVYSILNNFRSDSGQKFFVGEGWVPTFALDKVRAALRRAQALDSAGGDAGSGSGEGGHSMLRTISASTKPPTYHQVNKFTRGFQQIVDAYGVASYREVNPGLFTIITFPFLFGVMFGDIGHGIIMALFAFYLCYKEKQFQGWKGGGEIFNTIFGGRYIILLMGIFSIYTGFVYNDLFSKSINLFGSSWDLKLPIEGSSESLDPDPISKGGDFSGSPYVFGIDPMWSLASNKLTFINSYKMKMSVVIGVIHMTFGVVLSCFNHIYFKNYISIVAEFIPGLLFLECIFGYLVFLIIFKWVNYYAHGNAPSLLITLINMFLKPGKIAKEDELFSGQSSIQTALVLIAVACVPVMLLLKPFWLRRKHRLEVERKLGPKAQSRAGGYVSLPTHEPINSDAGDFDVESRLIDDDAVAVTPGANVTDSHGHGSGHFDFGEIFVHQCIHTIEFCLGCISNTASYLRLWALSLAHAELSEVLWNMVLKMGLKGNVAVLFFAWGFWAVLTVAVLLIMEGLSAFLHALRLHWVEFQNKFYEGDGRRFVPFSFVDDDDE